MSTPNSSTSSPNACVHRSRNAFEPVYVASMAEGTSAENEPSVRTSPFFLFNQKKKSPTPSQCVFFAQANERKEKEGTDRLTMEGKIAWVVSKVALMFFNHHFIPTLSARRRMMECMRLNDEWTHHLHDPQHFIHIRLCEINRHLMRQPRTVDYTSC